MESDHDEFAKIENKLRKRNKLTEDEKLGLSSYLCIVVHSEFSRPFLFNSYAAMLEKYPEISEFDLSEWDNILLFCNAMKVCSYLIPGNLHKQLIISTCAIIEGMGNTYITGSGATKATQLRVLVYEREFQVVRSIRKKKRKAIEAAAALAAAEAKAAAAAAAQGQKGEGQGQGQAKGEQGNGNGNGDGNGNGLGNGHGQGNGHEEGNAQGS